MHKIYYLSSCTTCKRILKELSAPDTCILQDIKTEAITPLQLHEMRQLAGTYQALLNKKSQRYKQLGDLKESLSEETIKNLILKHYTFLKRPVIMVGSKIFIGNHKNDVEAAKKAFHG